MYTANRISERYELGFIRIFEAPVKKLWQAWADPEVFARWWGPHYFTSRSNRIDFKAGGRFIWNMHAPEGRDYYSAGIFREIVPMKRIVAGMTFSNENGNPVPASYYNVPGVWPEETLITVTFEEIDGKTRMGVWEKGVPEEMKESTVEGWNSSLDKLAAALSQPDAVNK